MSKSKNNRKKKKVQPPAHHIGVKHSKSYLDTCYATARRIIRAVGEDESLFDLFTKRQKQEMFLIAVTPPYIAAMPGHKVPKQFIRYIQDNLTTSLKNNFFDQATGVTWMDTVTIGQSLLMICSSEAYTNTLQQQQLDAIQRLLAAFEATDMFVKSQKQITGSIKISLMSLSQPNFRIYGLATPQQSTSMMHRPVLQHILHVTTHECQTLRFNYHNRERTAFRVLLGPVGEIPSLSATIPMSKLFPDIKHDRKLDIYIQSHAIHRLKERIDTVHPVVRTQLVILSLMFVQRVVRGADGRLYIAYIMPDETGGRTIGYFAFTIEGNNLLVLTFLPLLSHRVHEGNVLSERLHLSPEDVKYLGMDKLGFFYDVDLEQIPVLKQILLDELHLDYIHKLYSSTRTKGEPFNEKKTSFVKNFFHKLEDRPFDPDDEPSILLAADTDSPATGEDSLTGASLES
ncbi:MAG: hypothetical protein LBP98_07780 [Tannerella sp.]|jgi:hypothetical protein|nr:hypothetical protein [Tannerella sp.]